MSMQRVTGTLTTILSTLLWALGAAVVVIGAAIIVTMDESSASQGGRYYVAVAAIVALWTIDTQVSRLRRRRLLWSITTQPAERRYQLRSFFLLIMVSLFLLGLAHYQTVGASSSLLRLAGYGLALGVGPLLLAVVLNRFVRKPFERGIDHVFAAGKETSSGAPRQRTFSFSFGTPSNAIHPDHARPRPLSPVSGERAAHYIEAWRRIDPRKDPAEAVRQAHRLILELCAETGHSAAFTQEEHVATTNPADLTSAGEASLEKIADARRVHVASRAALAGESAEPEDLRRALLEYERILRELLGPSNHAF